MFGSRAAMRDEGMRGATRRDAAMRDAMMSGLGAPAHLLQLRRHQLQRNRVIGLEVRRDEHRVVLAFAHAVRDCKSARHAWRQQSCAARDRVGLAARDRVQV